MLKTIKSIHIHFCLYLYLIFIGNRVLADEDMRQMLPGQVSNKEMLEYEHDLEKIEPKELDPYFSPDDSYQSGLDKPEDKEMKSAFFPSADTNEYAEDEDSKEQTSSINQKVPGSVSTDEFFDPTFKSSLSKIDNLGRHEINFGYHLDNYDYENANNSFESTYSKSQDSLRFGLVYFGYAYFISKKLINISIDASFALGFSSGQGYFVNGQQSDTIFKLYSMPIDLGVGIEFPLSHYFGVKGSAGGSLLGILQYRDDRREGEKELTQFSPGYYITGKFKISLSEIFKANSMSMFDLHKITKFYMTIDFSMRSYSSFKSKDLKIGGQTLGLGFSYEFL